MSLRESGLNGQIAAKIPLLKETNKKKRLAWVKKNRVTDITPMDIGPFDLSPNVRFLVPTTVAL